MIIQTLRAYSLFSNCYIVGSEHTGQGMVVDPSVQTKLVVRTAEEMGLKISMIVATHSHWDHVSCLTQLRKLTGAEFLMHEKEGTSGLTPCLGMFAGFLLDRSLHMLPKPDRMLHEGSKIELGDKSFNVIHTPGHSLGGICLEGNGLLFTGDTLFNRSIGFANQTMGRTGLSGFNRKRLKESIMSRLMILPDEVRIFPGHGRESTIGFVRKHNSFLRDQ